MSDLKTDAQVAAEIEGGLVPWTTTQACGCRVECAEMPGLVERTRTTYEQRICLACLSPKALKREAKAWNASWGLGAARLRCESGNHRAWVPKSEAAISARTLKGEILCSECREVVPDWDASDPETAHELELLGSRRELSRAA